MSARETAIFAVDFETTGLDDDCDPIEVGMVGQNLLINSLIYTELEIDPAVSAIHHIVKEDLEGSSSWEHVQQSILFRVKRASGNLPIVFIAHNKYLEQKFLGPLFPEAKWIDTYKLVKKFCPDWLSHSNEAAFYYLSNHGKGRTHEHRVHSAYYDACKTYTVYTEIAKVLTFEQCLQITEEPVYMKGPDFGKHKGKTWREVDAGYLNWILKQPDMNEDVKYWALKALNREI